MPLDWTEANLCDPSLAGVEGRFYVGQMVRYVPAGWQGFIHGRPIDGGPWGDQLEACRAVEEAWCRGVPKNARQ